MPDAQRSKHLAPNPSNDPEIAALWATRQISTLAGLAAPALCVDLVLAMWHWVLHQDIGQFVAGGAMTLNMTTVWGLLSVALHYRSSRRIESYAAADLLLARQVAANTANIARLDRLCGAHETLRDVETASGNVVVLNPQRLRHAP
jgi:hypothetical protein